MNESGWTPLGTAMTPLGTAMTPLGTAMTPLGQALAGYSGGMDAAGYSGDMDRMDGDGQTRTNTDAAGQGPQGCERCQGKGFVMLDVEVGHKLFGKALRCYCQDEAARLRRVAYLTSICRVPGRYEQAECTRPDLLAAIAGSTSRRQFVTVTGPYGVGKTTLLCGAVRAATRSMLTGVYVLMSDLLDHLRKAYAPNSDFQADHFWEALIGADVLAIDELDRFKVTEWAEQKLFQLLNERYNRDRGLTLFATNRSVRPGMTEGIIDDRPGYLESRLFEQGNLILALTGPDLRRQAPPPLL